MFKKKKIKEETKSITNMDFSQWEKDLGFLTFLMTQEIGINKVKWVEAFANQLYRDTDTITDRDIIEPVTDVGWNIWKTLSTNYIDFLCSKYFRGKDELMSFIINTLWMAIATNASEANAKKIRKIQARAAAKAVVKLNKKAEKAEKKF